MKTFEQFNSDRVNEAYGEHYFEFEYEDTYSKGHKCKCSGTFKSLEDAIAFFGFENDDRIIDWKVISNGADDEHNM